MEKMPWSQFRQPTGAALMYSHDMSHAPQSSEKHTRKLMGFLNYNKFKKSKVELFLISNLNVSHMSSLGIHKSFLILQCMVWLKQCKEHII